MDNIILIGMPGAGKSTVGVVLAKILGYDFIDSDLVIQRQTGKRLCEILKDEGLAEFIAIENRINSELHTSKTVIATGGSVVYGKEAMEHLQSIGKIVYLHLGCKELAGRLGDLHNRGVAMQEGQSLQELYEERSGLYEKYADITITCDSLSIEDTVSQICEAVRGTLQTNL